MSNRFWQIALALYLALIVLVAGKLVVSLFADPVPAPIEKQVGPETGEKGGAEKDGAAGDKKIGAPKHYSIVLLGRQWTLNEDVRLLVISIVMGALGSVVHALTSLADFVGNRRFRTQWVMWYALRPWIGSVLALVLYFVLRGGLLTAADGGSVNPFGIAAVCGMTGMFSKQATDKLEEIFKTLLRAENGADARRADKLEAGLEISEIRPPILEQGKDGQEIEILGHNLGTVAQVNFAGALLTPKVVEAGRVQVTLGSAQVAKAGEVQVFVLTKTGTKSPPVNVQVAPA